MYCQMALYLAGYSLCEMREWHVMFKNVEIFHLISLLHLFQLPFLIPRPGFNNNSHYTCTHCGTSHPFFHPQFLPHPFLQPHQFALLTGLAEFISLSTYFEQEIVFCTFELYVPANIMSCTAWSSCTIGNVALLLAPLCMCHREPNNLLYSHCEW